MQKHRRILSLSALPLIAGIVIWYYVAKGSNIVSGSITALAGNPYNKMLIDSGAVLLRHGDIIVRTGNDMTSEMFRTANQKDKTYSHCGVVLIENCKPMIYHCIGGEDNPDEVMRIDSLSQWVSPLHNTGFGIVRYRFTASQLDSLTYIIKGYYNQQKKFDMQFDITNDERLYCAELLYQSINKATNARYIEPTQWLGYRYVAVDDITQNPYCYWICQVKYK